MLPDLDFNRGVPDFYPIYPKCKDGVGTVLFPYWNIKKDTLQAGYLFGSFIRIFTRNKHSQKLSEV